MAPALGRADADVVGLCGEVPARSMLARGAARVDGRLDCDPSPLQDRRWTGRRSGLKVLPQCWQGTDHWSASCRASSCNVPSAACDVCHASSFCCFLLISRVTIRDTDSHQGRYWRSSQASEVLLVASPVAVVSTVI